MPKIIIQVNKNPNENNPSVLRRFSRKVRESGIMQVVKSKRYKQRKESTVKLKKSALKKIEKRKEIEKLRKLGKIK